jgi:hypothetical protein
MERRRIAFRYRLGERVQIAGQVGLTYTVTQQRYTRRAGGLPPVVEYLLQLPGGRTGTWWEYEPDLVLASGAEAPKRRTPHDTSPTSHLV